MIIENSDGEAMYSLIIGAGQMDREVRFALSQTDAAVLSEQPPSEIFSTSAFSENYSVLIAFMTKLNSKRFSTSLHVRFCALQKQNSLE